MGVAARSEWCMKSHRKFHHCWRSTAVAMAGVLHTAERHSRGSHCVVWWPESASKYTICWVDVVSWPTCWQKHRERTNCCVHRPSAQPPRWTPVKTRRTSRKLWGNTRTVCADCTKKCAPSRYANAALNASWRKRYEVCDLLAENVNFYCLSFDLLAQVVLRKFGYPF